MVVQKTKKKKKLTRVFFVFVASSRRRIVFSFPFSPSSRYPCSSFKVLNFGFMIFFRRQMTRLKIEKIGVNENKKSLKGLSSPFFTRVFCFFVLFFKNQSVSQFVVLFLVFFGFFSQSDSFQSVKLVSFFISFFLVASQSVNQSVSLLASQLVNQSVFFFFFQTVK